MQQIRTVWPVVRIIVRTDSDFCRDELMKWFESNDLSSGRERHPPFSPPGRWAPRPPVKTVLRLASLGLDGARMRCGNRSLTGGNGRLGLEESGCLPLVGTGPRRCIETVKENT